MPDKIVNPDSYDWSGTGRTPVTGKYDHLMDGNCREIDRRDYDGPENSKIMLTSLRRRARQLKLRSRGIVLDRNIAVFQTLGRL